MKMNYLTVGELIERLSNYDSNLLVRVDGGEEYGDLAIGQYVEEPSIYRQDHAICRYFKEQCLIMESED